MKNILLSLVILLVFGLAVSSCSSDDVLQKENNEQPIVIRKSSTKAHEVGMRLLESFGMTRTRSLSVNDYPDYYGGSYINEDGKLVVFLKGEVKNAKATLIKLIGDNDIIYIKGNYSYTELNNVLTKISLFIDSKKNPQIADNIKYYYLNDFENNVVVELDRSNEMEIKEFKSEVANFSGIVFKQCTREFQDHSLSPGSSIGTPKGTASMGYRATRFNTDGFVTAGHAYNTGDPAYYNNTLIGSCDFSIQGGSVDAAFISITNFSIVPNNGNLIGEEYNIWAGDNVTKLGETIAQSEGYITSTNANVNAGGISYTDMGEATYLSASGDSGGPVYLTNSKKVIGIHKGSTAFTSIFVKVDNIASKLNAHFN